MKKMKKILYPICAVILIIAVWNLWSIKSSTAHTVKLYSGLTRETEKNMTDAKPVSVEQETENPWLAKLQKQNGELVGWIRIPNTAIDYPVMQTGSDNDYYLTHDFEKNENVHGTPFLDVNCELGESENLIIYGHNMKDKTMFQNLMLYKDAAFCEANGDIEFDTPKESSSYRAVFVMLISEKESEKFPYYKCINLSNEEIYLGFLQQCSRYAIWESQNLPASGTDLLTLSTCEYSQKDGRLVVVAAKNN